jgi:hypothetical protein
MRIGLIKLPPVGTLIAPLMRNRGRDMRGWHANRRRESPERVREEILRLVAACRAQA